MGIWANISNQGTECEKQISLGNSGGVYDNQGNLISEGKAYKRCKGNIDKKGKCYPCDYVDMNKSEMYNLWLLYQKYVYLIIIVILVILYIRKK